jgi:hypothetical protein
LCRHWPEVLAAVTESVGKKLIKDLVAPVDGAGMNPTAWFQIYL